MMKGEALRTVASKLRLWHERLRCSRPLLANEYVALTNYAAILSIICILDASDVTDAQQIKTLAHSERRYMA
jgi:hypothetical protein